MRFVLIITIFIFYSNTYSIGQTNIYTTNEYVNIFQILKQPSQHGAKVTLVQDPSIENLIKKYIEQNKSNFRIAGYRIRILSLSGSNARSKSFQEKTRFENLFPRYPVYIEYEAPNFKVYVGDFRDRYEAFTAYNIIVKEFKNAFIVPSYINLPKIE